MISLIKKSCPKCNSKDYTVSLKLSTDKNWCWVCSKCKFVDLKTKLVCPALLGKNSMVTEDLYGTKKYAYINPNIAVVDEDYCKSFGKGVGCCHWKEGCEAKKTIEELKERIKDLVNELEGSGFRVLIRRRQDRDVNWKVEVRE